MVITPAVLLPPSFIHSLRAESLCCMSNALCITRAAATAGLLATTATIATGQFLDVNYVSWIAFRVINGHISISDRQCLSAGQLSVVVGCLGCRHSRLSEQGEGDILCH